MSALSLISRYARALLDAAQTHGIEVEALSAAAQLSPALLRDHAARFDPEAFCRISRHVKLLMDDEFCGFTRSPCKIGTFGLMCQHVLAAPTLGCALGEAFAFYAGMTRDIRFELSSDGEIATLHMQLSHPELDRHHFLHEWWFILWSHFASWLIGDEVVVVAADFPHPAAAPLDEYAEVLSGASRFSQPQACLHIPAHYLSRRVVRNRDDLHELLQMRSIDLVHIDGVRRSFKMQLKLRMKDYLRLTQTLPSIEEAAAAACISSQTLRRRLQQECTSYRLLKEEVRRERALDCLQRSTLPIAEVSVLAGFADANGLSRALKNWSGLRPSQVRIGKTTG